MTLLFLWSVTRETVTFVIFKEIRLPKFSKVVQHVFIYLFIMKFVQLGTQIKTRCEKRKYTKNTKNKHYEVHKNHIIKSTSDSLNSEI